jgi:hypothetical protein
MNLTRFTCVLICALAPAFAVDTKVWVQNDMADIEKGELTHLSLSNEGRLSLAPVVTEVYDPSVTFLWALARDSKGNVYVGGGGLGGGKAKISVIDAQGRGKMLAELEGITVQAIAIDRQDRVYAATSPDGKIYRVAANGTSEVFYDPKTKYIWAMAFSKSGDLFVATGDQGEIHRVTPAGVGSVFFRTEETHARSLTLDANDNLIVGTDPNGLVLRVTPAGAGFVLYQTSKREITAVAVSADGSVYAAGVGNRQASATPPPAAPAAAPAAGGNAPRAPALPPTIGSPAPSVAGGSEIYRIQSDGYPRKIWGNSQDLIYALAFDAKGRLLIGSGNRGKLYRIDSEYAYSLLLNVAPTQITGLAAATDGKLWAITGNIGKVFSIGPALEASGTYESDVLDAGSFSYWGRLATDPEVHTGVTFETRSGNLSRAQKSWSPWEKLASSRIVSPSARFLQYKATLTGAAELRETDVAYQPKNVAPEIEEIEITPANYKFPAPAAQVSAANPTLNLPPLGKKPPSGGGLGESVSFPALTYSKGQIGARWLASDENGDTLLYKLEIRGVNETTWKLVRDKIRERYCSWDSTSFPDGKYVARVTATDAPSNPPDQALRATRETDPFLIDNSPPEITGLAASPNAGKLEIRFHAKDALSWLDKAEYSVNGGDWLVVEPTTRLTDSQEHDYRVTIDAPQGEATIAVRVDDEYDNQAVAKVVVK